MLYMVLIYGDEQAWKNMPPEQMKQSFTAFMEYNKELAKSGVLRAGEQLQPSHTARKVSAKQGKVITTDGPFIETKEQLGGFYVLDVPSEEVALEWAAKCPAVYGGTIEVRPVLPVDRTQG
jgi:hypothetical protein